MGSAMLDSFATSDFPPELGSLPDLADGYVYVMCYERDGIEVPFYVGQTKQIAARMGDYMSAYFTCPTDFRVGEAARYFVEKHGLRVTVRYKSSANRERDEYMLIRQVQLTGIRLLNDFVSFDYTSAREDEERRVTHRICDILLAKTASA
jgi:hypothetical protein